MALTDLILSKLMDLDTRVYAAESQARRYQPILQKLATNDASQGSARTEAFGAAKLVSFSLSPGWSIPLASDTTSKPTRNDAQLRLSGGHVLVGGEEYAEGAGQVDQLTKVNMFYTFTPAAGALDYLFVVVDHTGQTYHVIGSATRWSDYEPTGTTNYDIVPLAAFSYTAGGAYVNPKNTQVYHEGDIILNADTSVPDTNLDPQLTWPIFTIERRPDSFDQLQFYNADADTLDLPNAAWGPQELRGFPTLRKDSNNSGYIEWVGFDGDMYTAHGQRSIETTPMYGAQIYKMDEVSEVAQTGMDFCVRTDQSGEVFWVDISDVADEVAAVTDARFQGYDLGGGRITINAGTWTRLGEPLSTVTTTLNGVGANDYVYVELIDTLYDISSNAALKPTAIELKHSAADPNLGDDIGIKFLIGKYTNSVWKQHHVGDIDDFMMIPDGEHIAGPSNKSIDYDTVNSQRLGATEIYRWCDPDPYQKVPEGLDYFIFQHLSDVGSRDLHYVTLSGLGDALSPYLDPDDITDSYIDGIVDRLIDGPTDPSFDPWIPKLNAEFNHSELKDIVASAVSVDDHDERYPTPDAPTSEVDANAGSYTLSGAVVASSGGGVLKLTAGGMYAAAGVYVDKGASAQAGYFSDGTRNVSLANGGDAIFTTGDIQVGDAAGAFEHSGNRGATSNGATVRLSLAGGGFVDCVLRGGILTLT